jgi:hypothetical protein
MACGRFAGLSIEQAQILTAMSAVDIGLSKGSGNGVCTSTHMRDTDLTPLSRVSDGELYARIEMQMIAKPIPADSAHTARSAQPIPTHFSRKYFPSHPLKI